MKNVFTVLALGLTLATNIALAEKKASGGIGTSIGIHEFKAANGEYYTTGNPLLPNLDMELNIDIAKRVGFKLQGSVGVIAGSGAMGVKGEITPMVNFKVADDVKLGTGAKIISAGLYKQGEYLGTTINKAIYGEVRVAVSNKAEMYIGASKNLDDKGYDAKIGYVHGL
ncbi:MAG: hypothetical protein U0T83_00665 [Bacteriovoracaceae bacterium]